MIYSLNYLKTILNKKKKEKNNEEDEPFEVYKSCLEFFNFYISKPDKLASKLKEICKLFCIAYLKTYNSNFINILDSFRNSNFESDSFRNK